MRICQVVHGFPPLERTGVENHTAALSRALVRAGHRVEVFTPRVNERLPQLSLRRELVDGFGVTWVTTNRPPRDPSEALDPPGIAERFGEFLDRERPDVVHFQHVIKVGLTLVEEAQQRGIPTIFTAHDYYGICHRYTLTRPDLTPCETVGDPKACTRCDLALSILNRVPELGDYHMGALPEQLHEQAAEQLSKSIAGDLEGAGFSSEEIERGEERRAKLDGRRAEIFAKFDLVLSPSQYLADRLVDAGLDAGRVRTMPLGIETHRLEGVAAPRPDPAAPLRFGFVGSLTKHKGVHVLLEAFGKLDVPAECTVWGGSTDLVYVRRMHELAEKTGVKLAGSFEQDELAQCLSQVDVLVVPSIWVENHPLTIREAYAAGRPVLASRLGALPENVRDGVDGLLFEPGDSDDLARVMRRLIDEPELYAQLASGLPETREISNQAEELVPVYAELAASAKAAEVEELDELPAHMCKIARRARELAALPTRDLFLQSLEGLGRLRRGIGAGGGTAEDLIASALSAESKTKITLRDLERRGDWLAETVAKQEEALREQDLWREKEVAGAREESDWLREQKSGVEEERDWLREKREELQADVEHLKAENERLRAEILAQSSTLQTVETEFARQFEEERDSLRDRVQTTAELALTALRAQESMMGREMGQIVHVIEEYLREREGNRAEGESPQVDTKDLSNILPATRRASDALQGLIAELEWRRSEMQRAADYAQRKSIKMLVGRTGLGRQVGSWTPSNGGAK